MKKLLFFASACIFALSVHAQNSAPVGSTPATVTTPAKTSTMPAKSNTTQTPAHRDGVMMKDGKMWMSKNGQSMAMDKEMTMKNGTKVMTDGSYVNKAGKRMKMKNGEAMDMEGKMMKADHGAMTPMK